MPSTPCADLDGPVKHGIWRQLSQDAHGDVAMCGVAWMEAWFAELLQPTKYASSQPKYELMVCTTAHLIRQETSAAQQHASVHMERHQDAHAHKAIREAAPVC